MPRDLFPFDDDRRVIDAFLAGLRRADSSDWLSLDHGMLRFIRDDKAVACYDTAGALCVIIPKGIEYNAIARVVAYIMDRLGMPEMAITREHEDTTNPDTGQFVRTFRYFMDGQPVTLNAPVVVCGPMTVQAHRASLR